jgi:mycofactocin precursor
MSEQNAETLEVQETPVEEQGLVAADLIEEVSIDGMCGVY